MTPSLCLPSLNIISARKNFWEVNDVSETTKMNEIDSSGAIIREDAPIELKGRVLLLVHGFNVPKDDMLKNYFEIKSHSERLLLDAEGKPLYDQVVGYAWPGCDKPIDYFGAEENAEKTSSKLNILLDKIADQTTQLDILAHSMGNRLVLEALGKTDSARPVRHFFSMGAAVDDESIERKQMFGGSIEKCQKVYIIYSSQDPVLKYAYSAAEHDAALGSRGVEDPSKLSNRVKLVDSSEVVAEHSDYSKVDQVYKFIQNSLLQRPEAHPNAKAVKLLSNGNVVPFKASSTLFTDRNLKVALSTCACFLALGAFKAFA